MIKSRLIKLSEKHLSLVYQWRNRAEVRENMYTNHKITLDEHHDWFKGISKDVTKEYFIFELDGELCGVIGFVDIDMKARSSSWAFYSGDTTRRGLGSLMEISALNYAFDILKVQKLYCEVLEFNESVIKFHRKHGFKVEGIFKKQYLRDHKYWDIYRLAIFEKEWAKCKDEVISRSKGSFMPGKFFTHTFEITNDQTASFAQTTGDNNKIHFDDEFAKNNGFDGKIVHGFLASSVFSKIFGTLFPGEGTIYLGQSLNFLKPVYPHVQLEARLKVVSKVGRRILVETTIIDIESDGILVNGEATLLLPITSSSL